LLLLLPTVCGAGIMPPSGVWAWSRDSGIRRGSCDMIRVCRSENAIARARNTWRGAAGREPIEGRYRLEDDLVPILERAGAHWDLLMGQH